MNWTENSIILSVRLFSETARVVTVFNRSIGKISAIFKNIKTSVQIGDISQISWRGRSANVLGSITVENITSPLVFALSDAIKIYAIESACTLCIHGIPEHAPHEKLYEYLRRFLLSIRQSNTWLKEYVFFEIGFLSEIGFGLDLSKCAVTGQRENLCYISPKTGHAVIESVGMQYKEKLFSIPSFMLDQSIEPSYEDIFLAMKITTHFLKMYFYDINNEKLPLSRECLITNIYNKSLGDAK